MTITRQVADLPGWQRARIDWIRVGFAEPAEWQVTIDWIGFTEVINPDTGAGLGRGELLPPGVTLTSFVNPAPLLLCALPEDADVEDQLGDLTRSGLLGDAVCDRITDPTSSHPRWRVQAWTGTSRAGLVERGGAGIELLAAHADLCRARWQLAEAEGALSAAVGRSLAGGIPAPAAAAAIGVTRGRIYQIRDRQR